MKKLIRVFTVLMLLAANGVNAQTYLSESFSTNLLPSGWTNDSAGLPAADLWLFNNPYNRVVSGSAFDSHYAIFDSDRNSTNDNIDENANLTTPLIDISGATVSLYLGLDEQYRGINDPTGSIRSILYSVDSGATWQIADTTVLDIGYPNPAVHSEFDLSAALGHQSIMIRFNFQGSWDWWWAIDNVIVFQRNSCTSPPDAGITVSSSDSVCTTTEFTLSLDSAEISVGLSYQWQSSPDGSTWTDIPNDTSAISNPQMISSATYYQCAVTCSGNTSYSVPVLINMNPPDQCYCTPVFNTGCDALNKVQINTLLNDGTGCNGLPNNYILYPDTGSATTTLGTTDVYPITIASGTGSGNHSAAVWFDFNHDGDFDDPDEYFHISDSIPELSSDFITPITIPAGAQLGLTRMRVRYIYNFSYIMDQSSDCNDAGYGETEDYQVTISVGSGVKENSFAEVTVFPNPANDKLTVTGLTHTANLLLTDNLGKVVKQFNSVSGTKEISITDLAAGVYFLRISNGAEQGVRRVVVY